MSEVGGSSQDEPPHVRGWGNGRGQGWPWTAARQAFLSFTVSQSLLKLMSIELLMPSNHLISLLSSPPPALNISQHQCLFK